MVGIKYLKINYIYYIFLLFSFSVICIPFNFNNGGKYKTLLKVMVYHQWCNCVMLIEFS